MMKKTKEKVLTKNIYITENNKPLYFLCGIIILFLIFLTIKVFNLERKINNQATANNQQQAPQPKINITRDQLKKFFSKEFIHFGSQNNKLLIVEVSDPSCPFCHIAAGHNPELAAEVGERFKYQSSGGNYLPPVAEIKKMIDEKKASFAFLYSNGHGNGRLAAEALYCAYEKERFWPVHDKLMTNEGYKLINETVLNNREKINELVDFLKEEIDSQFLTDCLKTKKYEKNLDRDSQISPSLGFQGTPHFIFNNKMFQGAYSFSDIQPQIKEFF